MKKMVMMMAVVAAMFMAPAVVQAQSACGAPCNKEAKETCSAKKNCPDRKDCKTACDQKKDAGKKACCPKK